MPSRFPRILATIASTLTFAFGAAAPAFAGVVAHSGPYDTLSAYPYAGASLDTRLGMTTGTIPVAWVTSIKMGNGGWELGLGSTVVSGGAASAVAFSNLAPWGRVRIANLWGVPLVFLAGATIPAATGSDTVAGAGFGASFDWEGDRVDLNLGARLNPADTTKLMQGAVQVLFTHPLGKDLSGNAELVFHVGSPNTANKMIERLGFTKTFNDNFAADLSVTLDTPLSSGLALAVNPSLGLTYAF
jgi:hypothetical protein